MAQVPAAHVGGSDARVASAAGGVYTLFPGVGAADLRGALLAVQTQPAVDWFRRLTALPSHLAWLIWLTVGVARKRFSSATTRLEAVER